MRTHSRLATLVAFMASAGLLAGCLAAPDSSSSADAPTAIAPATVTSSRDVIESAPQLTAVAARASADDPVNRVVAISVDGLNPAAITKLGRAKTPNFHRLMREGAYTLNARTAYEKTKTLLTYSSAARCTVVPVSELKVTPWPPRRLSIRRPVSIPVWLGSVRVCSYAVRAFRV